MTEQDTGKDVTIGSKWQRKDGRRVEVVDERDFRGSREVCLKPLDKGGRTSWKWDLAVAADLTRIAEER